MVEELVSNFQMNQCFGVVTITGVFVLYISALGYYQFMIAPSVAANRSSNGRSAGVVSFVLVGRTSFLTPSKKFFDLSFVGFTLSFVDPIGTP
jgi:hypothetical protein